MQFSRQEYWSELPCPTRDLPEPGIKPLSPALGDTFLTSVPLGKPHFPKHTLPNVLDTTGKEPCPLHKTRGEDPKTSDILSSSVFIFLFYSFLSNLLWPLTRSFESVSPAFKNLHNATQILLSKCVHWLYLIRQSPFPTQPGDSFPMLCVFLSALPGSVLI